MTMITAREARALVEQSQVLMEKYLADLGQVIEREARLGKSFVWPASTIGLQFRTIYETDTQSSYSYRPIEMTALQKLIASELEKSGYRMELEPKKVLVGHAMDDEGVREESREYIKISW
jgi:hypothetical protein